MLLISILLGLFWYSFTTTAPIVALPVIKHDLGLTDAQMQWIMTLRFCAIAAFVVFMGRVSDSIGRVKVYLIGLIVMAMGSILICIGTDYWLVIIGSVIIGLGGSASVPTGLALASILYPPKLKMMMISMSLLAALTGCAFGGLFGGLFAEYVNWRMIYWVFLAGMVLASIMCFATRKVDDSKLRPFHPDYLGTILLLLFSTCFLILFSEAEAWGLGSAPMIALYSVTPILLILLFISQKYVKYPIIDFSLLKNKPFTLGTLMICANQASWIGFLYVFIMSVQSKFSYQDYGPLMSGIVILPFLAAPIIVSPTCLYIMRKVNVKVMLLLGNIVLLAGILIFMLLPNDVSYDNVWWRFTILGIGLGVAWIFITPYAYSTVPKEKAGHAAGMFEIGRFLGNATGICVADAWFRGTFHSGIQGFLAKNNLNININPADLLSKSFLDSISVSGNTVIASVREVLLNSFHNAVTVSMIFAAVTVLLSLVSFVGKD